MKNIILVYVLFYCTHALANGIDVSIVGRLNFADGLYRIPIIWMDALKDTMDINFFESHPNSIHERDLPDFAKRIAYNPNKSPGKVGIYFDLIWDAYTNSPLHMPDSPIKFAYTMLESSSIPKQWVTRINNYFDGVIVPDEFLVPVYKKAGVHKPIFVLPIAMYLQDFLTVPVKKGKKKPFVFGTSATFIPRKNQDLIIRAFAKIYGNNPDFLLKLHGRGAEEDYLHKLERLIKKLKLKNVKIIHQSFCQNEYIEFMKTIDCYVFVSKGEGFSLTPREALALGIPCILSNNTSHVTVCKTNYVKSLDTLIQEPAYYPIFKQCCGYNLTMKQKKLENALIEIVAEFNTFKHLALNGRVWVQRYGIDKLQDLMKTIVKPKKIVLAQENKIESDCLYVNSKEFFEKLQRNFYKGLE